MDNPDIGTPPEVETGIGEEFVAEVDKALIDFEYENRGAGGFEGIIFKVCAMMELKLSFIC